MATNDMIQVANVAGTTNANGLRYVDVLSPTTIALYSAPGPTTPVAGNGVWSNGTITHPGPPVATYSGGIQLAGLVTNYTTQPHPRLAWNPAGELIEFAASIENGLLTSIQVARGIATATYTRAHGLAVGNKICIFGAVATNLNCSSTAGPTVYFTITAVPSPTTIQWTNGLVLDATFNSTNLTVSSWAQGGNVAWVAVNNFRSYLTAGTPPAYTLGRLNYLKDKSANMATICYVNRSDTEACTIAEHAINNPGTFFNNGACVETYPSATNNNCDDDQGDYASFSAVHMAYIYDLMKPTGYLDAGERAAFANAMLNDLGDGCTKMVRTNRSGTISVVANEGANVTLTGIGTSFLSQVVVGSLIVGQGYLGAGTTIYVNGVTNDTTLTVNNNSARTNAAFATIDPRTSTSCGVWWYLKHHAGSPLSQPSLYPPQGGTTTSSSSEPINNMTRSKLGAAVALGIVLADDDPRAISLLSDTSLFWFDYTHAGERGHYTGMTNGGPNYYFARVAHYAIDITLYWRNAFINGPDLTDAGYMNSFNDALRFLWHPNAAVGTREWCTYAFGADADGTNCFDGAGGRMAGFAGSSRVFPKSTETSKFMHWFLNVAGFNTDTIDSTNSYESTNMFKRLPANVTTTSYTSDPTQRVFRTTAADTAWCLVPGTYGCPTTGGGMAYVFSRTGWTSPSDTAFTYSSASFNGDHDSPRATDYCIVKGNGLVCGDSFEPNQSLGSMGAAGGTNEAETNMGQMGGLLLNRGLVSMIRGDFVYELFHAPILRWAGGADNNGRSDSAFAYALSNVLIWRTGITRQHRGVLHYKRAGKQEYVILWDDVLRTAAGTVKLYTHYPQNGEGGVEGITTCPSGDTACANINTSKQVTSATSGTIYSVNTTWVAPTGSDLYLMVDNPDGTYPTGAGHSYRVTGCGGTSSCASVTALEMFTVHKISTGAVTTISALPLNPSANWSGAQYVDLTYLHARGGGTFGSVPAVTTTLTTDYIAAGLDPGAYDVKLGGSTVCGVVAVGAGDNTIYCPNVGAGAITVTPAATGTGVSISGSASITGQARVQ